MSSVVQRWQTVCHALSSHTKLIAVSKYTSDAHVQTLAEAGQKDFGESKPQRLRDRAIQYPDLHWHMIGPLQKNKAKYIGRYAHMWHSCCDIEAAKAVAKHVSSRPLPTLVQVNISSEPQKQGVSPNDLPLFLAQLDPIKELHVIGLMGMAAKGGDSRKAFKHLHTCKKNLKKQYPMLQELCMGMSNDWRLAIQEGATMIRVGSEIFGND